MKILKQNLLSALELPVDCVASRASIPILNCLLLRSEEGYLGIHGTNLDESAGFAALVESEPDLEPVCVNASAFMRAIEFAGEEIEIGRDKNRLLIWSDSKTLIPVIDAKEFPVGFKEKTKNVAVNCADLATAIKAVKWCASPDEQRFQLMHVRVIGSATKLRSEAVSGPALAEHSIASIASDFTTMIHSNFCDRVIACLQKEEAMLSIGDKHLRVSFKGGAYECKLPESDAFVPTHTVLDKPRVKIGVINRDNWIQIMQFISKSWPSSSSEVGGRAMLTFGEGCWIESESGEFAFDKTVAGEFLKCTAKVNPTEMAKCLQAFPASSDLALSHNENALVMEHGSLTVVRQVVGVIK